MNAKEKILQVIAQLPDDVSVDQAIEKLYLLGKIESGLRQADNGDVMDHDEFKQNILGSD